MNISLRNSAQIIACTVAILTATACGMGGRWQPSAQLVALEYQQELGSVQAQLRISNTNEHTLTIEHVHTRIWIEDELILDQQGEVALSIPAHGVEAMRVDTDTVSDNVAESLSTMQAVNYTVTVAIKSAGSRWPATSEHEGLLEPTPGVPGRFR